MNQRIGDLSGTSVQRSWLVHWASLALLAVGAIARVLPLLNQQGRVFRQFPTEDGYLMLTIARNLALGHGPSIADGTILTNGTQPLATLLWAACFSVTGGDRFWGVFLVQIFELLIACGGAYLLWRLAQRMLADRPDGPDIALLATAVWFASPVVVAHSMNCLESGLYVGSVIAVSLLLLPAPGETLSAVRPNWRRWVHLGFALGLAFWARNDAVLLCLAVGFVHLAGALEPTAAPFRNRVLELGMAAVIVTLVALPWLAFNWFGFGHPMPISGQAESMVAEFGGNLALVPSKLLEYVTLLTPIPGGIEEHAAVVVGSVIALALVIALVVPSAASWSAEVRALLWVNGIYALLLAMFYGLYFGAPHFMSRYLLPTSPLFALLWAGAVWRALRAVERMPVLGWSGAAAALALALALNARLYLAGSQHEHFQVVEWVEQNVPEDAWVGAIQTGTLGFFHDRTLNLDGKVNPQALEARKVGAIPAYVRESDIRYVVDWVGIAKWGRASKLGPAFEVIVDDPDLNLAVLRRREPS